MSQRNLLLLSTSAVHGSGFFDYCIEDVKEHFSGLHKIIFVPFARPSGITHDDYTKIVRDRLGKENFEVKGIHEFKNGTQAIEDAQAIYIGGGNTFLLLRTLYENQLMEIIRQRVNAGEMRYMGSSAGTNVACKAINNTNDMPIVYPPSFEALNLVPFNINPHYLDPDPTSTHKGETRETRIKEFQHQSDISVVGLREGSHLKIDGNKIELKGKLSARIFIKDKAPYEAFPGEDLRFLLS